MQKHSEYYCSKAEVHFISVCISPQIQIHRVHASVLLFSPGFPC